MCNVTSITNTQLLCHPPSERPEGRNGEPPELVVNVGKWMEYNLGSVQFATDRHAEEYSSEIIGLVGAVAALVVFAAVIVLIMLRHKSSENERQYKRIQIQL